MVIGLIGESCTGKSTLAEKMKQTLGADLDTIKERCRARMRGNLPAPVGAMLEKKHGLFDDGIYDYRFDGANGDASGLCKALMAHR